MSRIRDVYPGFRIRLFSIPDPNCLHPGSRILIKKPKPKKWFLSSKKYDLGCSFRIPDPDTDFLPIPDPGYHIQGWKKHWIPDPDPQHWLKCASSSILENKAAQELEIMQLHKASSSTSQIRDILVRIRIRVSVPLTNRSKSGFGSCSFRQWPSRPQQKYFFFWSF